MRLLLIYWAYLFLNSSKVKSDDTEVYICNYDELGNYYCSKLEHEKPKPEPAPLVIEGDGESCGNFPFC